MSINDTGLSTTSFFQSDAWLFSVYIILTYEIVFWLCNGFLIFIEIFDIPSIDQYRIQKHKPKLRFQPDIIHLMIKETIVHQLSLIFLSPVLYYIFNYFGHVDINGVRPSWSTILFQLALFILSEDTIFFWTHYLLHTPWLYKNIHKKHHVYKQPTGVTAVLSDPIEALQTLAATWFMPILLKETHIYTLCLWVAIRVYQTVAAHSGYNLPYITTQYWLPDLMPGALAHDFHHQHGKWSYGSFFSIWDQLMGTHRLSSTSKKQPD
jgi:sterol desaturase/sphingolipid hydroxylase (fatty acid hydroxylase superfamily)